MDGNRGQASRLPGNGIGVRHAARRPGAPLVLACIMAAAMWSAPGPVRAQAAGDAVAVQSYEIAAGALKDVIRRYATQAGVLLSGDAGLLEGLDSAGLQGRYDVEHGFDALLRLHGLQVVPDASGIYLLRRLPRAMGTGQSVSALRPVRVQGRKDAREDAFHTPASVSVITREQIERLPPRNAGDLLRATAGVLTSKSASDPGLSVNIRGLQDFGRVNVMIDGVRQNFQQSGHHGADGQVYLDPALLVGVDVNKGPTSVEGGAGVIAGVVNFRTLEFDDVVDADRERGGRVALTSGSNAYRFSGNAAVGQRLGETASVLAVVSRRRIGDFTIGARPEVRADGDTYKYSGQDQTSALVKVDWQPDAAHALQFGYVWFDADYQTDDATRLKTRSDTVQLKHAWRPGGAWINADTRIYYTRTRMRQQRDETGYGMFDVQYETNTLGATLANASYLHLGQWQGRLRYGGEVFRDWTAPSAQGEGDGRGMDQWFTGPTPKGSRTIASVFSELTLDYQERWQAILGLRYGYYRLHGDGEMHVGSVRNPPGVRPASSPLFSTFSVRRHGGALLPRLTLAYRPVSPLQLYATYGHASRPPSITESLMWGLHVGNMFPFFPNPGLEPERHRGWEAGANLLFDNLLAEGDRFRMKAAWYDGRVRNYIFNAPVIGPAQIHGDAMAYAYVNSDAPVRLRGLELEFEYDTGGMFLEATWTRAFLQAQAGAYDPYPLGSMVGYPQRSRGTWSDARPINAVPDKRGTISLGARLLDRRLTLGARLRYQAYDKPERFALDTGSEGDNGTVYDLWASYAVNDALTLRVAVDNVLNRRYLERGVTGYAFSPGRTVMATASWKF